LRYIVILYSHDSFLNIKNPLPLEDRKIQALSFAKLDRTPEIEDELLDLNNDLILRMILDFLMAQKNPIWTDIITKEHELEEAIKLRLTPVDPSSPGSLTNLKRQLRIDCKILTTEIASQYKRFFMDHEDVKDKVRRRAISLELIALPTTADV